MLSEIVIDVQNLSKIYQTSEIEMIRAVWQATFQIRQSEFVAIMGPSGSGKSTLMNILGCLDHSTTGHYYLDGSEVSGLTDRDLAYIRNKKIGFVFQSFNLLPRTTALHNVELPLVYGGVERQKRHRAAKSALAVVNLESRLQHRPNELSGGQQQRVAIARALVNNPSLIMADEPTGNLDSKTSAEIMTIFRKLNEDEGKTIILITHEQDVAQQAKRIIRLEDGRIVEDSVV